MTVGLSLRRRLQIGLVFAVGALAIAIYVIGRIAGESDAARERAGRDNATTIARALRASPSHDLAAARAAVGAIGEANAGVCSRAGEIALFAANGPRGEPVDRPPPPDLADAIGSLCRNTGEAGDARTSTTRHPRDIAVAAVIDIDAETAAWAVVRIPRPDESSRTWGWPVALLAIAILALAVNTIDVLRALRAGIGQLGDAVVALEQDLRAPITRPRAEELGSIADGLREMADRLARARERELLLQTQLGHEQRLSALGRVVAGVAHEVRNPLAGIKLRLDVALRANTAPADTQEDIRAALGEVARLDQLVTSLLSVARRSAHLENLELAPLIDERLALLAGTAEARGVRLQREGSATITSDRDAVSRAIDNLVRNAIEVSPEGEVVTVAISRDAETIIIDVLDRGTGVPQGVELFEPFSTSKPDGVGLGTFIARSLVGGIGGSITYGREDSWTRMRISLPTS